MSSMSKKLFTIAEDLTRGSFFLFTGNSLGTFITMIGFIIIARFLGPSNYGLYSLSLGIPTLLAYIVDCGLNYALVRFPVKMMSEGDRGEAAKIIMLGFLIKLFVSIIVFFICYAGADLLATYILNRPELIFSLKLASMLIIFNSIYDVAVYSLIGLDKMQYSALLQILYSIFRSILCPVLILLGLSFVGAVLGNVLSVIVVGLIGIFILMKQIRLLSVSSMIDRASFKRIRVMLKYSLPLYLGDILTVFHLQYQTIILAYFTTNQEIGNFTIAMNSVFTLFNLILYPITTTIFAAFAKINVISEKDDLKSLFGMAVKYTSFAVIPTVVLVMILSKDLVYIVYGNSYADASQYFVTYVTLYLLTGLGYLILGAFFRGIGDVKAALKINLLVIGVFIPFAPIMLWIWHIHGLILAFLVAIGISVIYGLREAFKRYGVFPDLKANARIYIIALISILPTIVLLQLHLNGIGIINVVLGAVPFLFFYLTLAPILGVVKKTDIELLSAILAKISIAKFIAEPILKYESKILSIVS